MRLLADLHTHTVASGHAFSTITEMAAAASARGLELIAITDHGPTLPGAPHEWYFWNMKVIPAVMDGVRILGGVEANPVLGTDNGLDLDDLTLSKLDFVAAGLHSTCGLDGAGTDVLTEALLRVIGNPLVDMITHPGNPSMPVDVGRVVDAAVRHGVIIEINNASFEPTVSRSRDTSREIAFARAAIEAGAFLAITSDSHYHEHVGRFDRAVALAEELGAVEERIVNRDAASVLAHLLARRSRPRLV